VVELPTWGVVVPGVSLDTDVCLLQAAVVLRALGQQQVLVRLSQGGSDTARDDDHLGYTPWPEGFKLQWRTVAECVTILV